VVRGYQLYLRATAGRQKNQQERDRERTNEKQIELEYQLHLAVQARFQDRELGVLGIVVNGHDFPHRVAVKHLLPSVFDSEVHAIEGKSVPVIVGCSNSVTIFDIAEISLHVLKISNLKLRDRDHPRHGRPLRALSRVKVSRQGCTTEDD
jgi:hypothetical protein